MLTTNPSSSCRSVHLLHALSAVRLSTLSVLVAVRLAQGQVHATPRQSGSALPPPPRVSRVRPRSPEARSLRWLTRAHRNVGMGQCTLESGRRLRAQPTPAGWSADG